MKLTPREKSALVEHLNMHLQGMFHAAREIESDTSTTDDMEEFLDVMGHVNTDIATIQSIIKKAEDDINYTWGERASRSVRALLPNVRRHARRVRSRGSQGISIGSGGTLSRNG